MNHNTLTTHLLKTIQNYLWVVLVLFCMSSCAVKESILNQFGIEVEKPLNRTKTIGSCQYTSIHTSSEIQAEVQDKRTFTSLENKSIYTESIIDYCSTDFNEIKINSPPFYILYQQLKIAVVA